MKGNAGENNHSVRELCCLGQHERY